MQVIDLNNGSHCPKKLQVIDLNNVGHRLINANTRPTKFMPLSKIIKAEQKCKLSFKHSNHRQKKTCRSVFNKQKKENTNHQLKTCKLSFEKMHIIDLNLQVIHLNNASHRPKQCQSSINKIHAVV